MINIIKAVLEAAEENDFSLKSIDPKEKSNDAETDNMLYKEAYEKACIGIKTCYDAHEKLFREVMANIRYECERTHINQDAEKNVELHVISVNPQIDFNVMKLMEDFFTSTDMSKFNSSDEFLTTLECNIISQMGNTPITKEGYIGPTANVSMKGILVAENINQVERNIMNAADELYSVYEFIGGKIAEEKNPMYLEAYARMFEYCAKLISYEIGAYGVAALELLQIGRNMMSINESVVLTEATNEENAKKYIDEIDKLIDEIRVFYDKFEYKEIITPRKKKEHKMYEYVLGALERKYTLRIPIYKVVGASENVKDIVEHKFIDKLESITKKYPNFVILSPNWENESDMFIYITLREPFGEKEDRKDREQQAQNESVALTEAIDKEVVGGFVALAALIALGTKMTVSAIKESVKDNKKAKKMNILSEMIGYYDRLFSSAQNYISKAKFIKCKKCTLKFIDDCYKLLDESYKKYSKYTNEFNSFDKYYDKHSLQESKDHLLSIINGAKSEYKSFNEKLSKLYKSISSENEFVECNNTELLSKFKKLEKFVIETDYENVYEKFYSAEDSVRGPKGFDYSLTKLIHTSNPDYDKIMLMFWDETAMLNDAIKLISNLIKIQTKGKTLNESILLLEASLTKAEKDALEDYEFGLPKNRTYPLNDELHINQAIKFFGYCKAEDKKTLADNIVRRVIELNLVGVVTITEKHPNKNFFPEWMLNTCKSTLERKGNKYTIYVDGKRVDYGTLEDHSSDEDGARLVVVNESGNLF